MNNLNNLQILFRYIMEFAFLDESGNSGGKGTKYLILCLICTSKKKDIVKVIIDAKKRMLDKNKTRKWLNSHQGEIKFHTFPDENLLITILRHLSKIDICVYYVSFNKKEKTVEREDRELILTQLLKHTLQKADRQFPSKIIADMNFFNDEKINRFIQIDFLEEINGKKKELDPVHRYFKQIKEEKYQQIKNDPSNKFISIEHQQSRSIEELQAVDLIAGSIFQKLEHNKNTYYNILSHENSKIKIDGIRLTRKLD